MNLYKLTVKFIRNSQSKLYHKNLKYDELLKRLLVTARDIGESKRKQSDRLKVAVPTGNESTRGESTSHLKSHYTVYLAASDSRRQKEFRLIPTNLTALSIPWTI